MCGWGSCESKINPKLSRINCKLQLYRLWFNPTWTICFSVKVLHGDHMCTCPPTNTPSQPKISPKIKMCFLTNPVRGVPRRVKRPRRVPVEKKQAAQNDLQGTANGQNCTHTCTRTRTRTRVRALNVTLPHPVGVWYRNPERVPVYNQPFGLVCTP